MADPQQVPVALTQQPIDLGQQADPADPCQQCELGTEELASYQQELQRVCNECQIAKTLQQNPETQQSLCGCSPQQPAQIPPPTIPPPPPPQGFIPPPTIPPPTIPPPTIPPPTIPPPTIPTGGQPLEFGSGGGGTFDGNQPQQVLMDGGAPVQPFIFYEPNPQPAPFQPAPQPLPPPPPPPPAPQPPPFQGGGPIPPFTIPPFTLPPIGPIHISPPGAGGVGGGATGTPGGSGGGFGIGPGGAGMIASRFTPSSELNGRNPLLSR